MNGIGARPDNELMLTICPSFCRRMSGSTAFVILTMPKKLVSNWALASSMECSSSAPPSSYPALFTKTSAPPA